MRAWILAREDRLEAALSGAVAARYGGPELPDPLVATHAGRDRPREVGAHFLAAGRHLALRVPSRLAPATWLLLLNPRHPAFGEVRVLPGPRWEEDAG